MELQVGFRHAALENVPPRLGVAITCPQADVLHRAVEPGGAVSPPAKPCQDAAANGNDDISHRLAQWLANVSAGCLEGSTRPEPKPTAPQVEPDSAADSPQ
jgi:hypothetical protein